MMAAAGFEVKHRRGGGISFRAKGQERFTQLRASTLGKGYGPEDIQAIIEGRAEPPTRYTGATRKLNLIVDIQAKMRAGKGRAYEKWATIYNLKQMAAALQYLQENNLMEYEQLEQKATEATDRFHSLSDSIKSTETAMKINTELKAAIIDYAKTQPVFDGYKAAKYSKKYLAEHGTDLELYRAARKNIQEVITAKANIDHLLGLTDGQKNKEMER